MVVDIGKIEQHANEASFKYNNEWDQCETLCGHLCDIKTRSMSYPARRGSSSSACGCACSSCTTTCVL